MNVEQRNHFSLLCHAHAQMLERASFVCNELAAKIRGDTPKQLDHADYERWMLVHAELHRLGVEISVLLDQAADEVGRRNHA